MTKKDIVKILHKEVGFLDISEDEDIVTGELYITDVQFKEIEQILNALRTREKVYSDLINEFRKELFSKDTRYVVYNSMDEIINDKEIGNIGKLFILDCQRMFINGCIFNQAPHSLLL